MSETAYILRIDKLEAVIQRGLGTFVEVGKCVARDSQRSVVRTEVRSGLIRDMTKTRKPFTTLPGFSVAALVLASIPSRTRRCNSGNRTVIGRRQQIHLSSGKLAYVRIGRRRLVPADAIETFIQKNIVAQGKGSAA